MNFFTRQWQTTVMNTVLVLLVLLTGISAAGLKYVAVVESDIDEASGASEKISRADVRLVTAELRREAVKNLPPKRYSIMTSETVMSMGGAVLEECAEENCVIALGSRIGADFIVRGTVSKLESKFTLQVEMYETENGTLVASCEPVRAESIGELIEKTAAVCANMYKTWVVSQKTEKTVSKISIGGGAFFASDFGGGSTWKGGNKVGMPFYGGGAYLTVDFTYAAILVGYSQGGGNWVAPSNIDPDSLPYMRRSSVNFSVFSKYPSVKLGTNMNLYPMLGFDYELPISGKLEYANDNEYLFDGKNDDVYSASALSALWVKIGGGMDIDLTKSAYIHTELLYGARTANLVETDGINKNRAEKTRLGHGLTVKAGAGLKL
jgi:hypothetical protein